LYDSLRESFSPREPIKIHIMRKKNIFAKNDRKQSLTPIKDALYKTHSVGNKTSKIRGVPPPTTSNFDADYELKAFDDLSKSHQHDFSLDLYRKISLLKTNS
jgi:hypothetical protein